jgi:HAD superfamily hydrolase (TIGR01549 family)
MPNYSKRAVLFDLDGTLRHNDPSQIETFFDFARALGVDVMPDRARAATRWIHTYWADSDELKQDRERYGVEWETLWLAFAIRQLRVLGVTGDDVAEKAAAIQQRMIDEYEPTNVIPDVVPGLLEDLQRDGCRLAVVSNRRQPIADLISDLGLGSYFDLTLAAGEVGFWKPDHRLLKHAADELGVPPDDALYVGDNYFADVPAAQGAGMDAVLLDPDDLFPEATCRVIRDLVELPDVLAVPERL